MRSRTCGSAFRRRGARDLLVESPEHLHSPRRWSELSGHGTGGVGFIGRFGGLYPIYVRGQAHLAARQPAAAAAEFQRILDHRSIVLVDRMDAMARLQLARALALSGDPQRRKAPTTISLRCGRTPTTTSRSSTKHGRNTQNYSEPGSPILSRQTTTQHPSAKQRRLPRSELNESPSRLLSLRPVPTPRTFMRRDAGACASRRIESFGIAPTLPPFIKAFVSFSPNALDRRPGGPSPSRSRTPPFHPVLRHSGVTPPLRTSSMRLTLESRTSAWCFSPSRNAAFVLRDWRLQVRSSLGRRPECP